MTNLQQEIAKRLCDLADENGRCDGKKMFALGSELMDGIAKLLVACSNSDEELDSGLDAIRDGLHQMTLAYQAACEKLHGDTVSH